MGKKIYVVVFGLNRNPDLVLPAFKRLISQLRDNGQVSVFLGFIVPDTDLVVNARSQEKVRISDPYGDAWQTFTDWPVFMWEQPLRNNCKYPSSANAHIARKYLQICSKRIDPWGDGHKSTCNYLNYLWGARAFGQKLAETNCESSSLTLVLRPDIIYTLDSHFISTVKSTISGGIIDAIWTLGYQRYSFVNDRMFIGTWRNCLAIMRRVDWLGKYLRVPWRYLHAERFTQHFISRSLKCEIRIAPPEVCANRVRANNVVLNDAGVYVGNKTENEYRSYFKKLDRRAIAHLFRRKFGKQR